MNETQTTPKDGATMIAELTTARDLLRHALVALELQPKPEAKWARGDAAERALAKRNIRRYLGEVS